MNEKEKITDLALRILASCRNYWCISYPYLHGAFAALACEPTEQIAVMGTDGKKLFFNPGELLKEYVKEPKRVRHTYLHTVLHCLFLHPFDKKENIGLWNRVCDRTVEAFLENRENEEKHMITVQQLYGMERGQPLQTDWKKEAQKAYYDDHSLWFSRGDGKRLEEKWEQLLRTTIQGKEKNARYAGAEKGNKEEEIQTLYRSRYDYKKFLEKYVFSREEAELDTESFDYIFYNFGMGHYGNIPLIEPLEYKEVSRMEELVIAIDTSGSCSRETVQAFLGETYGILSGRENFFKKMKVYILQCDCCIQDVAIIHSPEEWKEYFRKIKIEGRGGTDFRPVFRYVNEQKKKKELKNLKVLIYFTDGDGIYPGEKPDYETAFVFMKKTEAMRRAPGWALRLVTGNAGKESN